MIDILLATYNGEKFLEEQLNSIFNQSFQDFTLLIRDDGSTDSTMSILQNYQQKHPHQVTFITDKLGNLGSSKSFLVLLENSTNDYIMLCDQDDIWEKNKIALIMTKMDELEQVYHSITPLLVFSDMIVVDKNLNILNASFWKLQKLNPDIAFDWKKLLAQNVITGCTIMINRAAKRVSFPYVFEEMQHDHWIGVNVAKYGQIDYIQTPTLLYRQHDSNVEGAHNFGWYYVGKKIKTISQNIKKLYKSAFVFHDVSFLTLLWYKLHLNFERLIK